jgi:hypothetical protein
MTGERREIVVQRLHDSFAAALATRPSHTTCGIVRLVRSIAMLGLGLDDEHRLHDTFGGSPALFFQLAQRIAFGLQQPDLIRVDVLAAARTLIDRFPEVFAAHLFHAWAWRARDPERADRSLARARQLAPADHPWSYLLPLPGEWGAKATPQELVALVPDRVWRVAHRFPFVGSPLLGISTTTIVRTSDGALAIVNPVALAEDVAAEIEKLGRVRWIISQGKVHSGGVNVTRARFPHARALGTHGHLSHPPARGVVFDGLLGNMAMSDELELYPVRGHALEEVEILHRPTGTLIVQDLVLYNRATADTPFINRLYGFAFGLIDRIGMPSFGTMMWQQLDRMQDDVRRILDSGYSRIVGAHWAAVPSSSERADVLASHDVFELVLATSGLGHKLQLARYVAWQPTFIRDFVKYQLALGANRRGAQLRA